jgi:hypothetical protein
MILNKDENGCLLGYRETDTWIMLVNECEDLIGHIFVDETTGEEYRFFGLVHSDDDFYYGMHGKSGLRLLSCVGNLEVHKYRKLTNDKPNKRRFDSKL